MNGGIDKGDDKFPRGIEPLASGKSHLERIKELKKENERLRKALEDIKILVFRRWVTNMPGKRILEIIDKELKGR